MHGIFFGKRKQLKRCSEKFTKLSVSLLAAVFPIKLYGGMCTENKQFSTFSGIACILSYIHQNVSMPDFVTHHRHDIDMKIFFGVTRHCLLDKLNVFCLCLCE